MIYTCIAWQIKVNFGTFEKTLVNNILEIIKNLVLNHSKLYLLITNLKKFQFRREIYQKMWTFQIQNF